MRGRRSHAHGFTLIELVVSIVIAGIVVGFIALMIGTPVQAYMAQARRSDLSDGAESAMRSIDEDVRRALPNSVRAGSVGNLRILEVIRITASASYREVWPERQAMQFGTPVSQFSVLEDPGFAGPHHVVIDNRRTGTRSAYAMLNVITPSTTIVSTATTGAGTNITISPGFQFTSYADRSTHRRAYLVPAQGVIRYECDLGTGELRRYASLPITNSITAVSAPSNVIADDITACRFRSLPGNTPQSGGIAIIEITVSRAASGAGTDRLRMVRQIRVENAS